MATTFDPHIWAVRFRANGEESGRNSMMDSGWSGSVAERCDRTSHLLLVEIYAQLLTVKIKPEDFFDRPALAAVLAAVHESAREAHP